MFQSFPKLPASPVPQDSLFLPGLFQLPPYGTSLCSLFLCQPQSPPPPRLLMQNHHGFQTLTLVYLSSLLSYESSHLSWIPVISCPPSHPIHSPNIPGPSPTFNSTAHGLPLTSNAIFFFFTWQIPALASSPAQVSPPQWSPVSHPSLLPHLILPQNPVYISSTPLWHTIWNLQISVCFSL